MVFVGRQSVIGRYNLKFGSNSINPSRPFSMGKRAALGATAAKLSALKRARTDEPEEVASPASSSAGSDIEILDADQVMSKMNANGDSNISEIVTNLDSNNQWHSTINKVVKSVVSIHFAQTASFDCDASLVSEATGFVVDAEQGIILTNRHVVGAGPFVGYCVFDNHEEVDVIPIYRDPVHDFGFLKFDPKAIKYMKVQALELRPDLAKVGCEIRVVGNDAGEKLSILAGFISRIDRNAPEYGGLTYNDFNTEYIQAAASASGGSSGSPVVDINGYAVALQAGGSTEASTDFFLPVYRVLRALKCIQSGQEVTRGTIQVQWFYRPFDECRRLGLSSEAESEARKNFPNNIGLLVAEVILPEGPAEGKIKEGDTLISINGEPISTFIKVDDILDSSIDKEIELVLQRGGKEIKTVCKVQDLHSITPNRYLEVGGGSFNDVSYQMARIYAVPVKGVFINSGTGSFLLNNNEPSGWIVGTINDIDVNNLDEFIEVMKTIPDKSRISIIFRHISDLHAPHISTIYVDRHWCSSFRIATRNDKTGLWDFKDLNDKSISLEPKKIEPNLVKFIDLPVEEEGLKKLSNSLVLISSIINVPVDSYSLKRNRGYGLIIDAVKGYAIVSRFVVPHDCLDVHICFAESLMIPGQVVFLHPTQNYTIIKYDPSLIKNEIKTPVFSDVPLKRGDKVKFIGYNYNLRVVTTDTKVSDIATINIPRNVMSPRYRGSNLETIAVESNIANNCGSGVLADTDGTIRALWLSFLGEGNSENDTVYKMGIDITEIKSVISKFQNGESAPKIKIIDCEFFGLSIVQARIRGVPKEWILKVEESGNDRLQFLAVGRVSCQVENNEFDKLEAGDIILSIEDKLIVNITDLPSIIDQDDVKFLNFKIIRRKKEMNLKIPTFEIPSTNHLVFWCGAVLQAPHHAVRQSMMNLPSEVYVTTKSNGSPARQYGINSTNFITHVNEIPTPTLSEFIKVVKQIGDNTYCKLRLVSFDNIPFAISIKTNYHYFPTGELKIDPATKKWVDIEYNETNEESKKTEI